MSAFPMNFNPQVLSAALQPRHIHLYPFIPISLPCSFLSQARTSVWAYVFMSNKKAAVERLCQVRSEHSFPDLAIRGFLAREIRREHAVGKDRDIGGIRHKEDLSRFCHERPGKILVRIEGELPCHDVWFLIFLNMSICPSSIQTLLCCSVVSLCKCSYIIGYPSQSRTRCPFQQHQYIF